MGGAVIPGVKQVDLLVGPWTGRGAQGGRNRVPDDQELAILRASDFNDAQPLVAAQEHGVLVLFPAWTGHRDHSLGESLGIAGDGGCFPSTALRQHPSGHLVRGDPAAPEEDQVVP